MKKFVQKNLRAFFFLLISCCFTFNIHSQQSIDFAMVSQGDVSLKKTRISSTAPILSGEYFLYHIDFSVPIGCTNIIVSDVIPQALEVASVAVSNSTVISPLGSNPSFPLSANTTGSRNFQFNIAAPTAGGFQGTISFSVRFAPFVTCDGTEAKNSACMTWRDTRPSPAVDYEICTNNTTLGGKDLIVFAKAINKWYVTKRVLNFFNQGTPGGCNTQVAGNRVRYRVDINHPTGPSAELGALNLSNVVINDALATYGGTYVNGSFTQLTSLPYNGGIAISQGGTAIAPTFSLNSPLIVTTPNPLFGFEFEVDYPLASVNCSTPVNNSVTLSSNTCNNISATSNLTCALLCAASPGNITKNVTTTGVKGCPVDYRINVSNTTNASQTYIVVDTLPTGIGFYTPSGYQVISSGPSISVNGMTASNNQFVTIPSLSMVLTIPANSTVTIQILGVLDASYSGPSPIVNTANLLQNGNQIGSASVPFEVKEPSANLCMKKEIVNQQPSYALNGCIRYRLKIRNLGQVPVSSVTLSDVLNSNLQGVSNIFAYKVLRASGSTGPLNTDVIPSSGNCVAGPLPAPFDSNAQVIDMTLAVNPTYNASTNTITFLLNPINLPPYCSQYQLNCGYDLRALETFYLEFTTNVRDTAGIGATPNIISAIEINGSPLTMPTQSNVIPAQVNYTPTLSSLKEVRRSGVGSFASSLILNTTNEIVDFRLNAIASGGPLSNFMMCDMLPSNDGTNDFLNMNKNVVRTTNTPRLDLTFENFISSTIPLVQQTTTPANNYNTISNITSPFTPFPINNTASSVLLWNTALSAGAQNQYFRTNSALSTVGNTLEFKAKVNGPNGFACNTFALNATKKLMNNNGASFLYATLTPIESNPVCIELRMQTDSCMTASSISSICGNIVNNVQTYVFTGSVNNYNSSSGNLTISPMGGGSVNMNPTIVPANTLNQSFSFNYTPSVDAGTYCFLVSLSSPTFKCIDTVCFKTPNCPLCCEGVTIDTKQKECCSKLNIGKCEVKSIEITLNGGTLDNIDIANCADPIPGSYQGMSHYIITGCFNPQSVLTCVKANQGVTSVVISYLVTFVNGETCKREDKVTCTPPEAKCCPTTTVVPTCTNNIVCFSFTSSPFLTSVCSIILSVNPSTGVNSTSLLDANNNVLAGSVNINDTTNFTGAINNHIYFQLNMPLTNPQSTVTIRYILCSGDTCDAEIFTIGGISANKVSVALTSVPTPAKLFATSFQLDVSKVTNKAAKVKTISILPENDNEQSPLFFSITGAEQFNDKNNALIAFERTLQGSKTANFILQKPLELINFQGGQINIVTYRKVERYKVVMFDENNSIISEFSFAPLFTSEITATKEFKSNVQSINLSPNPTSERSILSYTLKENQNVKIDILDMSGKLIKSLDNGFKNADTIESIEINTENLVSGVYLVSMILGNNNVVTEKLVVTH